MKTSLSSVDQAELARLLKIVAVEDKGFIPDSSYDLVHKMVPWPAVEVLITDEHGRYLLAYRNDQHFKGWHIPGTFIKPGERLEMACRRCVQKENVAKGLASFKLIGTHAWNEFEHPYGYPISLIMVCKAEGEIVEREDLKWFELFPDDTLQVHQRFIGLFSNWKKGLLESTFPEAKIL